jgi:hypothetical protein
LRAGERPLRGRSIIDIEQQEKEEIMVSLKKSVFRRGALTWLVLQASAGLAPAGAQMSRLQDPDMAPRAQIDRFSSEAGHLMVRTMENGIPGPNQPIDFDQGPFITRGLGPDGEQVRYYNFDVQPTTPAPIYVLFHEDGMGMSEETPVEGQLNIVDAIPGDEGYNDFWQIMKVTVPADYEANTITSLEEIRDAGYAIEATDMLVNCPIVPEGSTARLRAGGESADLHRGWFRGQVVFYFTFEGKPLRTTRSGEVPISPIYVTFNRNPDQPDGGPVSGFVSETGSAQTHNVVQTIPSEEGYSPLWLVNVYDNADFARVTDLRTAAGATILARGVAAVNCPIVSVDS